MQLAQAAGTVNLTQMPAYPHLNSAAMDDHLTTEAPGRWCSRFTATTSDPVSIVAAWYRKALVHVSETDLRQDPRFAHDANLSGIKLSLQTDYVLLYSSSGRATTIELHRCHWTD